MDMKITEDSVREDMNTGNICVNGEVSNIFLSKKAGPYPFYNSTTDPSGHHVSEPGHESPHDCVIDIFPQNSIGLYY